MTINSELVVTVQKSADGKQYKLVSLKHVPYASSVEYLSLIPSTRRHIGQIGFIANGANIEFWMFIGGILDIHFVKIFSSAAASAINETILFTAVATLTLPWNAARIAKFGASGSFYVEVVGDDGFARNTVVEIKPDSIITTTEYVFDFGGVQTGRITIS